MSIEWRNWSGSQQHQAKQLSLPESEAELLSLLDHARNEDLVVRPIGSAHSFVPFWTDDILLSLDNMKGIRHIDSERQQVTMWAGTKLHEIGQPLFEAGFAMTNMGDIDRQSIAGAIGTGTHGTGRNLQNISNQLASVRVMQANGEILNLSAEDGDLFRAVQVSMGTLGVVTEVTLNILPAYHLVEKNWESSVDECGEVLEQLISGNRHFEFFWDPAKDICAMKTLNPVEVGFSDGANPVGPAHEIIPSTRELEFNEIEFSVPYESGWRCFLELRSLMQRKHPDVRWPLEYRTLASDQSLLSTAHGRESVTISAHQSNRIDHRPFFLEVENLFGGYDGRPHWGKVHTHRFDDFSGRLPGFERFCEVRQRLDPEGRFLNSFLHGIFGTG
ncbi:MAG: FAD/FMN-containing dehydrogenase [Sulfitobacter sp.]|jgi:FAD/FMN-containing dehydrogenase